MLRNKDVKVEDIWERRVLYSLQNAVLKLFLAIPFL